jgi:hypothetical protein
MNEQETKQLELFLDENRMALWPAAVSLVKALELPDCVADFLTMALPKDHLQMREWFESGRLPCSFSLQPLWEPLLTQLDHFDQILINKKDAIANEQQENATQEVHWIEIRKLYDQLVAFDEQMLSASLDQIDQTTDMKNAITKEQQKVGNAVQGVQSIKQEIEKLKSQLIAPEEAKRSHADKEKALLAELGELQQLDLDAFLPFVRSAAQVEKELVSELEAQLVKGRKCLAPLNGTARPKLSLLLNCFGASVGTIRSLPLLDSKSLISSKEEKLKEIGLSMDQQIILLYTRERLLEGKLPFAKHDCPLCNCIEAEEMDDFLNKNGVNVKPGDIRKTRAYGRGALLFLTAEELNLQSRDTRKALQKCRQAHYKSKN